MTKKTVSMTFKQEKELKKLSKKFKCNLNDLLLSIFNRSLKLDK